MSTLTRDSTYDQICAAYDDNASYHEDASRSKALAFITACHMLARLPISSDREGQSFTRESLREEIARANAWLAANPPTTGAGSTRVRYGTFRNFRD